MNITEAFSTTDGAIETIAAVAHETNRRYAQTLGDDSIPPWSSAPDWQRNSVVTGVAWAAGRAQPPTPGEAHENWRRDKLSAGWTYGPTKDAALKTHPNLISFSDLPVEQRAKDAIFLGVVLPLLNLAGLRSDGPEPESQPAQSELPLDPPGDTPPGDTTPTNP